MLFTLSSSVLLVVAGSTVRASPIMPEGFNFFGNPNIPSSIAAQVSSKAPAVFQDALNAIETQTSSTALFSSSSTARAILSTNTAAASNQIRTTSAKSTVSASSKVISSAVFGASVITSAPTATHTASFTSGEQLTTIVSTFYDGHGQADRVSTFVVPVTTPTASKKTSAALSEATKSAAPKATLAPGQTSGNGTAGTTGTTASGAQCDGTNDGAVVCSSDGTEFGLCDHGGVVMMPVAKGTACRNGAIDYIADVLDDALTQIKTFLDSSDNATDVFGTANPAAVDASNCPAALLYLKDSVDSADSTTSTGSSGVRFGTNKNGKAFVDGQNKDVQLVLKPDGTAGFQVQHQCGGSGVAPPSSSSAKVRRQDWILWCLL